ncbi:MAG: lipopolysaccharide biosynthesis protein [Lachnospiraceae bacterium]|nr:lipopolysaccharide biosynthesis protein [Lachnospiraceae bacterium]
MNKKKVLSGVMWRFGERIMAQLVSLIVSIVLARFLLPEDYGSVALVMVFINIANVFIASGLGNSLIQKKDADNVDFSSVFYINIIMSMLIYMVLFFSATYIARFYSMPILCPVLRVLAIRIPISAVNSVQQAYVSKHMMFRLFFWSTLIGTVISGVVGIVAAYTGYGIWALVIQDLMNVCIDTIVLWFTVKWRPDFTYSWKRAKGLISYGWKILVSGLIDTGYNELRNLIIGKLYKSSDLAYYNQGDKYPKLIVVNVNAAISGVLFPVISNIQDNSKKVKNMTRSAIMVSSFVIWPLLIGIGVIAEPLVRLVLTEKWIECVPFMRVFCFTYGLWPIHVANLQAIKAIGRSDLYLKLEVIKKAVGIAALIISVKHGPFVIACSFIVTDILSTIINAFPNRKLLNYKYSEQLKDLLPAFLLSIFMGIVIYPISFFDIPDFLCIVIQILCGGIVYLAGSVFTKQPGLNFIISILKDSKKDNAI